MNKEQLHKEIIRNLIYPRKLPFSVFLEELSGSEFMLMAAFLAYEQDTGNPITVNELATQMDVTVPAVSRTLRRLEERGLIKRVCDEECRRNTHIKILSRGQELFDINRKAIEYLVDKLLDNLSTEEIEKTIEFNKKLANIMDAECREYFAKVDQ